MQSQVIPTTQKSEKDFPLRVKEVGPTYDTSKHNHRVWPKRGDRMLPEQEHLIVT